MSDVLHRSASFVKFPFPRPSTPESMSILLTFDPASFIWLICSAAFNADAFLQDHVFPELRLLLQKVLGY
jgi:hypothetical protein